MSMQRQTWFEGWRLFFLLTAVLAALCIGIAGMHQFDADGVRMVIRFTARTSLLFFCLAFSAAATAYLWPNGWTRWQRRNRRQLGVTFAASHGLHAVAIAAFAAIDPVGFAKATSLASFLFGGIGYAFIAAMTATSFDRSAAWLGPRAWRALHLVGGYYLLLQFTVSFGKRIPDMPLCALFLIPLALVLALRMIAMVARQTPRAAAAGYTSPPPKVGACRRSLPGTIAAFLHLTSGSGLRSWQPTAERGIEHSEYREQTPPMVLALLLVAVIGAVALTERSVEQLPFAIAALFLSAALLLIFVGDVERAILLAGFIALAIAGASMVKFDHSALKLTVSDLPLAFAGTVPFLVQQYPRMMLSVLLGSISLVAASTAVLLTAAGPPIDLESRIILLSLALVGFAAVAAAKGESSRASLTEQRCFYSTFIASLIDPVSWQQFGGLAMSDIADEPLPLKRAVPARTRASPDIIVIQHESIFDPRMFGLPVEPSVEAFLSPAEGRHGALAVDIFGGGSWQSEFSLLTGLSSASFGASAYYLFKKGAGRFHTSLPYSLGSLGYRTTLISSCRRNFLHYDEFYRSIGINERIFADDLPPPFDIGRFEATNSDALFLEAVIDDYTARTARDPAPRFLYALTSCNHGPHDRRLAGQSEARGFAMANCGDAGYAEYYARLAETASIWQRLRSELALSGRPTLIVHYGDHQPVLTRRLDDRLAGDARRAFRTFYAIEVLNTSAELFSPGRGPDLDIAFLGTIALQAAGLPLDPIFSTRASLIDECGASYFASGSERKRRFHRTLVELGLVDLGPRTRPAGARKPDLASVTRTRPTH